MNRYTPIVRRLALLSLSAALLANSALASDKEDDAATIEEAVTSPDGSVQVGDLILSKAFLDEMFSAAEADMAIEMMPVASPSTSGDTPSGWGSSWGTVFAALGGTNVPSDERSPNGDSLDGSLAIGFGLGDPSKYVGMDVVYNLISLTNNAPGSGFNDDASMSVKLHRRLTPNSSVAVGWNGLAGKGAAKGGRTSNYVAYSSFMRLSDDIFNPYLLSYSVGLGNEVFADFKQRSDSYKPFGSIALNITPRTSVYMDVNANQSNLGVSIVPFLRLPVVMNFTAFDVAGQKKDYVGDSLSTRFGVTTAISYQF